METKRTSGTLITLRVLFCILLLAVPLAMHAQQYSGTITGTVTDPSGATLAGASVTLSVTGSALGRAIAIDGYYDGSERLRTDPAVEYEGCAGRGNRLGELTPADCHSAQ